MKSSSIEHISVDENKIWLSVVVASRFNWLSLLCSASSKSNIVFSNETKIEFSNLCRKTGNPAS